MRRGLTGSGTPVMAFSPLFCPSQGCGCSAGAEGGRRAGVRLLEKRSLLGNPVPPEPFQSRRRKTASQTTHWTTATHAVRPWFCWHCCWLCLVSGKNDGWRCLAAGTWEAQPEEQEQNEAVFNVKPILIYSSQTAYAQRAVWTFSFPLSCR